MVYCSPWKKDKQKFLCVMIYSLLFIYAFLELSLLIVLAIIKKKKFSSSLSSFSSSYRRSSSLLKGDEESLFS